MRRQWKSALLALVVLSVASIAGEWVHAAERPDKRLLFIGIDGCRSDAVETGKLPNLQGLIKNGAVSYATSTRGDRANASDTISGPGWSNLLTGVWPDKHGVLDNDFKVTHYDRYPHFFRHVKQAFPAAKTCSYCVWEPIQARIVSAADEAECFNGDGGEFSGDGPGGYRTCDERCTVKTVKTLTEDDPDAMFVYLGSVDVAGHRHGFHPSVPEYKESLKIVDGQIGRIISALHKRPRYEQEHWLVLVSTDHGGQGTSHSSGQNIPETHTVFLIASGPDAARGKIDGPTAQVDVVATALAHLGVAIDPKWQLDGKSVGLKKALK